MAPLTRIVGRAAVAFCCFLVSADALTRSAGCGKALAVGLKQGSTGSSNNLTITSSGIKRTYLLHIPEVYTATNAHGLIFSFHGRSETAHEQERLSQFSEPAFNPGSLVVYPLGINEEWQGDPDAKTNDVQFTLDIISNLTAQYCIDTDRIFAAGKSNGGGFAANVLPCDPVASTKIAAYAGISGAYYQGTSDANCNAATVPISCNPGRSPIPIFETHGSADPVIPYYGGARRSRCLPTVPHFMTAWSQRNGLGSSNVSSSLYNANVVEYQFGKSKGLQGIDTHYWVNGLGHAWPSTKPNDDGPGTYFNATPLIMDFFAKWTLSSTPRGPGSGTLPSTSSRTSVGSTASSVNGFGTFTAPTPSSSAVGSPACPAQNGTTWKAVDNDFEIFCGFDTSSSYYGSPKSWLSFGSCIAECDADNACDHVVYNGACYLKKAVKGLKKTGTSVNVAVKST